MGAILTPHSLSCLVIELWAFFQEGDMVVTLLFFFPAVVCFNTYVSYGPSGASRWTNPAISSFLNHVAAAKLLRTGCF